MSTSFPRGATPGLSTPRPGAGHGPAEPPPGRVDPEHARVLKLFTVLSRAHAALHERTKEDIARHGLTQSEFAVLEALYHKGPLLHGEIRDAVLVSRGGITYLVDRLEARGLLERRACPTDRRARYAALTREGIAFLDRIFPEHARALEAACAALTPQEQIEATGLLRTLGKGAQGRAREI
jgi:MarR family transcriptional regulator, 2-MHQ and catechol-resistance regulon repressor